ncbi:hypothetical protein [Baekduia sp. Peel2402]|uniref:hypothetical protein n=1 Tax=Baekduia sp. Peel2402 TaxID=3458296 RepID=UPI00403EBF8D
MTDRPEHEAFAEQIRALTGAIEAPPSLREGIEEQRRGTRSRVPRGRRWIALPIGGLVAAAAVAVALLVGGGAAGPTVDEAAALALQQPNLPAPKIDTTNIHLVKVKIDDLQFPNYGYEWSRWKAIGHRIGTVAGRDAKTVTYRGPLGDVGYAIVAGDPLPEPKDARYVTAGGQRFAVVRHGDAVVVTWRRGGHTCVLAGRGPGMEERLVSFAAWA